MKSNTQTATVHQALERAIAHYQSGQLAEAEALCRQILSADPKSADTLHLMGVMASQAGNFRNAVKFITQAIKANGNVAAFYSNLGYALQNLGEDTKAVFQYERALALQPDMAEAHINIGNILMDQGKLAEAAERHGQAVACSPGNVLAHYNLGLSLQKGDRLDESAAAYRRTLELSPLFAEAHLNLGAVYKDQGRLEDAAAQYERALEIRPDYSEARNNLGAVLNDLGRTDAAIEQYAQALALVPDNAKARNNMGLLLSDQGKNDDAVAQYRQAIELDPDNALAYINFGSALKSQGKVEEAIAQFERAAAIDPRNPNALGSLLHQLQHVCAWDGLPARAEKLLDLIREEKEPMSPFIALCIPSTPADQFAAARTFGRKHGVPPQNVFQHPPGRQRDKIRIGYLSADFHQHATAHLMAEMFERHDRARFEITGYSYGPDDGTPMRQRIVKSFDHFVELRKSSHAASARKIHDDGIDILIDLKGYTESARLQIPAYRPAPVQVNFLGYPGTLGTAFADYIIADKFILPMDQQPFYSEKIVQLPDCYQPNDTLRKIADRTPTRAECGLPEQGFVFCCFNAAYKITPEFFDIWMSLLKSVPGSVLWLLECNAPSQINLRREAEKRGIGAERIIFASRVATPEYLARHRLADLFLDTLPVNAHTTTSDSLWAGLPVLTCAGTTFAGRVAGSLLLAAGMPELVTHSLQDYEGLALRLAQNPGQLRALRQRLEETRLQVPLFDIARFVKNIERAYETMWKNWQAGEAPKAFAVDA